MAVQFMNFFFALAYGAFTIQTNVKGSSVLELFCYHISVYVREQPLRDVRAH